MESAKLRVSETNGKTENDIYDWAYTVDISPYKMIKKGNLTYRKKWCSFSGAQQQDYLKSLLTDAHNIAFSDVSKQNYNFELTQAGNVHVHGHFTGKTIAQAHEFQKFIHELAGFPKDDWMRVCYITPTEIDIKYYDDYQHKEEIYKDINYVMFLNKNKYDI